MRVLVYGMSADKLGGIETYLLNMNDFITDDIIFDYVIEGNNSIHQNRINQLNGTIEYISPKKRIFNNIYDWTKLLFRYKKKSKLVYFNMYSLAWVIPILLCKLFGFHVIVHAHNNNLHDCGWLQRNLHCVGREILKHSNVIRFTNSALSETFFFGSKKAELIYNAIDTKRFSYDAGARSIVRAQLGVNNNTVYGFTGRIAYQKNPIFLIDIFSEIKNIDSSAAFVVCGEGDLMDDMQKHALEKKLDVHFLGSVDNVQMYYQAMDCYVLPSRFEGLGIVLIEAQCTGLPCITSAEVVPETAKVTELLSFMPLSNSASEWAEHCVSMVEHVRNRNRAKYSEEVSASHFDICKESKRIAAFLKRYND